jgi:hypothetical protein
MRWVGGQKMPIFVHIQGNKCPPLRENFKIANFSRLSGMLRKSKWLFHSFLFLIQLLVSSK